jgi:uncharacterized protein (DUF1501 family)
MHDTHLNRRVFVKAGGLALVSLGLDPLFLTRAAYALHHNGNRAGARKTLICVFQRGAVDGLNMIVPHGDSIYYEERPAIAVPRPGKEGGALDLDGHFGLHPALGSLLPLYRDGSLSVVHAVGSPAPTRSHFDAQDFMESGTPGRKGTPDGWLGRCLEHEHEHEDTPFRGVALGPHLPLSLRGTQSALAVEDLQSFGVGGPAGRSRGGDRIASAFEELYRGSASGIVATSSEEAFEAARMLRDADVGRLSPDRGADYPRTPFGQAMRQLAQLIKSDLGLEIGFADVGGWDTHVNQGASEGQLAFRLGDFGNSLAAFATDLGPRMADVMVLTMSEFGRTIRENGSHGTDHGRATAMMVMGAGTNGGKVLGRWPSLDPEQRIDGRDLAVTTDFRDLFSEVVARHLGATDLPAIFPGFAPDATRWVGAVR